MVNIKGEEFNHIYALNSPELELLNGEQTEVFSATLELYDKSLAIANDLKRLPMIRDVDVISNNRDLFGQLDTGNTRSVLITVEVYNGDHDENKFNARDEDLLFIYEKLIETNTQAVATMTMGVVHTEKVDLCRTSIIGKDKITIVAQISSNTAVGADTDFGNANAFIEIDWKEVTPKQVDAYIRESWFRDSD